MSRTRHTILILTNLANVQIVLVTLKPQHHVKSAPPFFFFFSFSSLAFNRLKRPQPHQFQLSITTDRNWAVMGRSGYKFTLMIKWTRGLCVCCRGELAIRKCLGLEKLAVLAVFEHVG